MVQRSLGREWHGFSEWLATKFDYPSSVVAAMYLRNTYPDDLEALRHLTDFYLEYDAAKKSGSVEV